VFSKNKTTFAGLYLQFEEGVYSFRGHSGADLVVGLHRRHIEREHAQHADEADRSGRSVLPIRVTRLSEFSPIGRLFTLGSFFENERSSPNFGYFFSDVEVTY
jgi:hypothetical protein